jgi:DNA-directed RNA polymerase subunit RPC12/RpoP
LKCPECNNDLKISKKDIGDHVRCWYCGETFLVMKGLDQ